MLCSDTMAKPPSLSTHKVGSYTYWATKLHGKRFLFGRTDSVTRVQALRKFVDLLESHNAPLAPTPATQITVTELIAQFIESELPKVPSLTNRKHYLTRFAEFQPQPGRIIGELLPQDVATSDLTQYLSRTLRGRSGHTLKAAYAVILKCWGWAVRRQLLPAGYVPFPGAKSPQEPTPDVSEASLVTDAEIELIFERGEPYGMLPILRALYATGARPGELCRATVRHFSKRQRCITLAPGEWKSGKKTRKHRVIPLPDALAEEIAQACKGKSADDPIFTGPAGAAWTPNRLDKLFRRIRDGQWRRVNENGHFEQLSKRTAAARARETAMREELSLYSLRHRFITDALLAGESIHQVAQHCGTSVKMLERTYAHFRAQDAVALANRVAEKRNGRMD